MQALKTTVRSLYNAQKLRIEMSNRLTHEDGISEDWRLRLQRHVDAMRAVEKDLSTDIRALITQVDIYTWLEGVRGCGPTMAAVLLSELQDPARFATVSKLWAYLGLHTLPECASCGKLWGRTTATEAWQPTCQCNAEPMYRAARKRKGHKANWNNFAKSKLLGVLAPCFLKSNSPYRQFYDNYKTRLANRPCAKSPQEHMRQQAREAQASDASRKASATHSQSAPSAPLKLLPNGCTPAHMHNKAMRYMIKMFLQELWIEWRTLRGLDVREPYAVEYLGREHSA